MKEVMEFYMKKGVSGFRLDAVSAIMIVYVNLKRIKCNLQINHMFEDPALRDEPENPNVPDVDNYE